MNTDAHGLGPTTEAQSHREDSFSQTKALLCVLPLCLCASAVNLFAQPPEPRFEPQTIDDAISIGYGVDVGDVDGDGKPDILLADQKQFVWYRNPGNPGEKWPKFIMAENLTERDNVCITARDIDGDGKVEVAVGGNWNPSETTDPAKSGAIFYLIRPKDPTQKWDPVQIKPHDPTVHRMRWVHISNGEFVLAILPLHGVANRQGEGAPVRLQIVRPTPNPQIWESVFVDTELHLTHNFDVSLEKTEDEVLLIGGREGLRGSGSAPGINETNWIVNPRPHLESAVGEVRFAFMDDGAVLASIEPMHGDNVVIYHGRRGGKTPARIVLDATIKEGHALTLSDFVDANSVQVVAGWRQPNAEGKIGIRMYVPQDEKYERWKTYTIDDNTMACEDMKVADLDGDGRLDIVASGRATKNVVVYWNRTEVKKVDKTE